MGNAIGLGWMCAGLGVAVIVIGLTGLMGWTLPVDSSGSFRAVAVLIVGFGLLGAGTAAICVAAIADAMGRSRGGRSRKASQGGDPS